MTKEPTHLTSGWLAHVVAAVSVATLVALLGAPPASRPLVRREQERGVVELASLLAAPQPESARIEENIRSWTRFPPEEETGRMLSSALASCSLKSRSDAQRVDLARRLYAITNGIDVSDADLVVTLREFEQAANVSRCNQRATSTLVSAVRLIARNDPKPRSDWW